MEDNSYVSLSLEKYNELYDKAKKFDALTEMSNELIEMLGVFDTADEENNEEEIKELKVGDKVKLIKKTIPTMGYDLGDICTITDLDADGRFPIEIDNGILKGYVDENCIEKI